MSEGIKSGYLLEVTTWENDADNYNTIRTDGLTEDEVRFYLYVCGLFDHSRSNSLGNEECHGQAFTERLDEHMDAYDGPIPEKWVRDREDKGEFFYQDRLGNLGINSTEYGYWRVFDSGEVFLVPQEIQNVSSQFQ